MNDNFAAAFGRALATFRDQVRGEFASRLVSEVLEPMERELQALTSELESTNQELSQLENELEGNNE